MNGNEILTYLIESGTIDLTTITQNMNMRKKEKTLEKHKFKIWQGENGRWYTFLPDKFKGRRLVKRASREDLEVLIIEHYEAEERNPMFKTVFEEWSKEKLQFEEICKGTYDRYFNEYKRFFGGKDFERYRIGNITEQDIDKFIRETIAEEELTRKGFANFRTLIMGPFKYAKKQGYTELSISSFFKDLELSRRIFKPNVKNPEKEVFSEDEIPRVIQWLQDHPKPGNLGLILAFETGLRTGELAALKVSDIEGDTLHVQRQEIRYKLEKGKQAHEVVEFTKTDAGNRYIYLPKSAMNTIKQIRLTNPFGEYLIMEKGKRLYVTTYAYRIRAACKALGIPERSMHKIRKTYGTTLIDSGVDDSLIMSQMGHANIQTTRNYYYFANKNNEHKRQQIQSAINF